MGSHHSHNHSHSHPHSHLQGGDHAHSHAPVDFGTAFAIGIILNTAFVIVEATYGYLSGSMALIADAGHNLSDVLALLLAWAASVAAKKPANARFTYGYKSSTILAALANAMLLAVAIGAIAFETVHRMIDPVEPQGMTMIIVAGIGILINAGTALLFMRGRHSDLNIRGAFLHMTADALVSLGVVIAGVAILFSGMAWIDPLASLMILAVIGWGTWGLARDSLRMGLLGVPDHIDEAAVAEHLAKCPGVAAVHDLHIWPMSTTETALTAHLVMPGGHPGDDALKRLSQELSEVFGIQHTTLQVELMRDACDAAC
ncbi:cation diffusion facilitator family transporter [Altererythrobacter sp. GH1-8]|uniref:cation diffusion facilitator family transporter n=1 Tax=Altererythrobacter sp. GH1-8 TaxID=3349333 RepID=UPI00374CBA88